MTMLRNYLQFIKDAFRKLPPPEQEKFLRKAALIVTVGTSVAILGFFYSLVPREARLVLIPVMFVLGWYVGDLIADAARSSDRVSAVQRSIVLQNAIRLVLIAGAALVVLATYAR